MKTCKSEGCINPKPKRGLYCNVCRNSKQRYGIDGPQREKMLLEQKSKCKLCERTIKFDGSRSQYSACIDHCHSTGKVRGVLCGNCNTWLGYLENNSFITTKKLEEYLK